MIEKLKVQDFNQVYRIMEASFPSDEYRPYAEQKALLSNPVYTMYVWYGEPLIKAFIAAWAFDTFAFIEHFAVNPEYRNGGIGAKMLNEVVARLGKTVCLEVEPPENEMASRRIGFYQRNNFFLSGYPYIQPPISQGKNAIPLSIMTTNGEVDKHTFEQIKTTLYTELYKCIN